MNVQLAKTLHPTRADKIAPPAITPVSKRGLRIRVYATMIVLDCLIIAAAFLLGNLVRSGGLFDKAGLNIITVLLPIYIMVGANRGIYSGDIFTRWRHCASTTVASFAIASVALLLIYFYLQATAAMSREVFSIGAVVSVILLFLSRRWLSHWANRAVGGEHRSEIFIRDGVDDPADLTLASYDAELLGLRPDISDPMMLDRLGQLLHRADRVVVGCPPERRTKWAMALKGANIGGEILVADVDSLGVLGASTVGSSTTLIVSGGPLDTRSRALKRALDLSLASGALIALAPVLLVAALAVRVDSPGSVFFKQQRLGRGNRLFAMYKFRSMRSDQCDSSGNRSTQRDDDRITRVGRFIRATSIDELPQLLNILKGDMSFVGPRPHALGSLAGDKLFWEIDQRYWHRHASKPGLTGLAQIRGFRGATHLQSDLVNRLQADLEYLNGWSIWRDISILLATFKVLIHKNAY